MTSGVSLVIFTQQGQIKKKKVKQSGQAPSRSWNFISKQNNQVPGGSQRAIFGLGLVYFNGEAEYQLQNSAADSAPCPFTHLINTAVIEAL